MKKLMVLGGSHYVLPVINIAHELGLYVITCDYLPNNFAHRYSDEYRNVSIIDKEETLEVAKRCQIDGIISFACDPGVLTAAYVSEKMGLPSVGSYESVSILQNKNKFRKFLSENGFNVPKAKGYIYIEEALHDVGNFSWPIIVKPTDSAGSKGVTKVDNPLDLEKSIRYALKYSFSGEFIIEDYIQQKGYASDSDCFSVDGELKFVSFNSQYFDSNARNPYTPAGFSWPALISEEAQHELEFELQRLISLLNLKTSLYNVETRVGIDGKAYIMECSPRGGGNRLSECLEYATGAKLIENAVRAAVGMPIIEIKEDFCNEYLAEIILRSNDDGVFNDIFISEEIINNIVNLDIWVEHGDFVECFSAANKSIGTVILKFDDLETLRKVMNDSGRYVKVILNQ